MKGLSLFMFYGLPSALAERRNLQQTCTRLPYSNIEAAWNFAKANGGTGMAVYQNDGIIFEEYKIENICGICGFWICRIILDWIFGFTVGGGPDKQFQLYSATKSLSGLATVFLLRDNHIDSLDDAVASTVNEWASDPNKSKITYRELLTLSSGIETDIELQRVGLENALHAPFVKQQFAYGSQPFTILSYAVLRLTGKPAESYLQESLFNPLGLKSVQIESVQDNDAVDNLAGGGSAILREMIQLGVEIMNAAKGNGQVLTATDVSLIAETFSPFNAAYGLSVWRNAPGFWIDGTTPRPPSYPACGPSDVFHMLGAGGQIVTIVPTKQLVVVKSARFGPVSEQDRQEFWSLLFANVPCVCEVP